MTQDEHLAAAILNEIYDTKVTERLTALANWVAKIKRDASEVSRGEKSMTIDVLTPDGVAVHIRDAVSDIALTAAPELTGRLVEVLVNKKLLNASDLRSILPPSYEVRE